MEDLVKNLLIKGLDGDQAHLSPERSLDGLNVAIAGKQIENAPHTIWQLIEHLNFWQERFLAQLKGMKLPGVTKASEGWPEEKAPAGAEDFKNAVDYLLNSIGETKALLLQAEKLYYPPYYTSAYALIRAMGSHLSYHLGQVMMLRRMAGDYPPPSGGDNAI